MFSLKTLIGVIALILAGWAGWWYYAAGAEKSAVQNWMEKRRAAGWRAEAADISVLGFPNRLDLKITEPALADPESGWSWSAPWFEVAHVIWQPTLLIAIWPPEQSIGTPLGRAALRSDQMRASIRTRTSTNLTLERASFEAERPGLTGDGWAAGAERAALHIQAAPEAGPENAYRFRADVPGLRLPEFLRKQADPTGALPPEIERVTLDGRAAFTRPLDRHGFEGEKPQFTHISLTEGAISWGRLTLNASGAVKADANGYAEGAIDITATNWREMLDTAAAAGAINRQLAETLKSGLGFLAAITGGDLLSVTLKFSGGRARIGPVPVGAAPRLIR